MSIGVILRKGTKNEFMETPPEVGEIVFCVDTNEIGTVSNGSIIWQRWDYDEKDMFIYRGDNSVDDSIGVDGDKLINVTNSGIIEYRKNIVWEVVDFGVSKQWLDVNIEPNWHNINNFPYLGKYTNMMESTYSENSDYDISTLGYLNRVLGDSLNKIIISGKNGFNESYSPSSGKDVITLGFLLSGNANFSLPIIDPLVVGAVWNNNGKLVISGG